MSYADKIFIKNCTEILMVTGTLIKPLDQMEDDNTPAHTIKKFGIINEYDLSNEFPIMTLRKINYKAAIDELLWMAKEI